MEQNLKNMENVAKLSQPISYLKLLFWSKIRNLQLYQHKNIKKKKIISRKKILK